MLTRMDALEGQIARLTATVEEQQNRLDKMDARLALLETGSKPVAAPATGSANQTNLTAMNGTAGPTPRSGSGISMEKFSRAANAGEFAQEI